ncbi:MAG TPA: hypothetical protein GX513_10545 [Firmicutes bacterium]|nr:hypothetical protein [Bacillota bacterium]
MSRHSLRAASPAVVGTVVGTMEMTLRAGALCALAPGLTFLVGRLASLIGHQVYSIFLSLRAQELIEVFFYLLEPLEFLQAGFLSGR